MRINAVTNYGYSNNICKNSRNNPTFGNIPLSDEYKQELEIQCGKKTADEVIKFCEQKINLKNLIGYDKLPKTKKALADEYFKVMSPSEVEDFTVEFFANSENHPYYFDYDCSSRLDKDIVVKLYSQLPTLTDGKLELEEWNPFEIESTVLKSSLWGDTTEEELVQEREKINKRLNDSIGFKFAGDTWIPVPSENLYNVIAKAINDELKFLGSSKSYRRHKKQSS